jgi:hypothetical protein
LFFFSPLFWGSFFACPDPDEVVEKNVIDHVTSGGMASSTPGSGAGAGPLVLPESCYNMIFFLFFFFLRQIGLIGH